MNEQDIYQQLESLKAALISSKGLDDDARDKILALIDQAEQQLPTPEGADDSISEQFESLLTEFEVTHPTLTGIVNNILVSLGNMGV